MTIIKYNSDIHHRRSIRLKEYDYSQNGAYFITICAENREHIFGEISDNGMHLNKVGRMILCLYLELKNEFIYVNFDKFVIMPNHFHCIIENYVGADSISAPDKKLTRADMESAPTNTNLAKILQSFKRHTTIEYINGVKNGDYPPFIKRIWQRNYYENIIRNEQEYQKIAEYIDTNPLRWKEDCYNDMIY